MPVGGSFFHAQEPDELLRHCRFLAEEKPTRVAVAVSGGSDSVAALHLVAAAAREQGVALFAVTVDHALRAESAAEAAWVGQLCAGLGVPHHVLVWQHGAVAGNLMDAARRARYAMMADWAEGLNISHIVLGHTADDQAETFLMGVSRRAGIDGLIGMQNGWNQGRVRFLRPFLQVERGALRAYLAGQGVAWLDDPSNENDRFTRVKARRILTALKPLGITVGTLTGVIGNLAQAQGAVLAAARDAAARICTTQAGEVFFEEDEWQKTGAEAQRRVLIAALRWICGGAYAPRGSGVTRVLKAIEQRQDTTLAGCRIRVAGRGFRVVREPAAVAGLVSAPGALWDGRWRVDGPFVAGHRVRALGAAGLRQCKTWRDSGYGRDSLLVSPAVWYDEVLIAAPLAGFQAGFSAQLVPEFQQFCSIALNS